MRRNRLRVYIGVAAAALAVSSTAFAQDRPARDYDIAARDLKGALRELARESGLELLAVSDDLRGKPAPALKGHYTPQEALALLLRGTGLSADIAGRTIYVRGRSEPQIAADGSQTGPLTDIVVTGSRIRGATPTAPLISLSRDAMRDAGQNTLPEVIRSIPQNFSGGQNPGVGLNVPESRGISSGSSSTLNLRGLGSDATLTLLNGHRLAYSVANQSVDVSTIPVVAIERLEIVADGASALYGSDAVGGVANVILRRDYQGLSTRARVGESTDGGNQQQQYDALAGAKWSGGGDRKSVV